MKWDQVGQVGHGISTALSNLLFSLQEFEDYRDADDAVYELNGKDLCGERYSFCLLASAKDKNS